MSFEKSKKETVIEDQDGMSIAHNEMLKTLQRKSEECGVDISDILEELVEEKDLVKVYKLIAEAISKF